MTKSNPQFRSPATIKPSLRLTWRPFLTGTAVMQELGMGGHRRQPDEPFLIGLTATPYRGHNEREAD